MYVAARLQIAAWAHRTTPDRILSAAAFLLVVSLLLAVRLNLYLKAKPSFIKRRTWYIVYSATTQLQRYLARQGIVHVFGAARECPKA